MKTPLLLIILLFGLKNYSQCSNVPSNSTSSNLTYTFVGGSFQSYGCAPIDPTYWMAGNGNSVTATLVLFGGRRNQTTLGDAESTKKRVGIDHNVVQ